MHQLIASSILHSRLNQNDVSVNTDVRGRNRWEVKPQLEDSKAEDRSVQIVEKLPGVCIQKTSSSSLF